MPLIRRIALWACFFTLIYLGVTRLASCKSETAEALDSADDLMDTTEEAAKDVQENVKEIADRFFEDDDEIIYTNEDEDDELVNDLFREAETSDAAESTTSTTRTQSTRRATTPERARSSSTGRYLVVAGNYLVETNAKEMVRKLRNMGFNGAEHLVFDQSQYFTVIASRSDARNGAQSSSDKLKAKGIDNYVHTQRN